MPADALKFEYVTSAVSLLKRDGLADGIVVHIVNDSDATEQARVVIYHNTGAGAVMNTDTGPVDIVPTWMWGVGFTIPDSGEYWVRVQTTSACQVPQVTFDRSEDGLWVALMTYKPGDFAVFSLKPSRMRVW